MQEPAIVLTEGQRNHLEILFRSLITESADFIDWSNTVADDEEGPDEVWLEGLRADLQAMMERLQTTSAALGISVKPRAKDPRRRLMAWSATWWAHVLDCRSTSLRAYGTVDPGLPAVLDPAVEEIADRLLHIEREAQQPGGLRAEGPR